MSTTVASTRSYVFLAIAIFGWGLSVPFVEFGLSYISPLPFLAYRFLLASLLLTPFVVYFRRSELGLLLRNRWTWIVGLSESFGLIAQYLGQAQGVPSGLAALLSLCFLLIVPFLSPLVLDESLKLPHALAIVVGFTGIVFISTEGKLSNLVGGTVSITGVFLLLGAAFGYALYIVSTSRLTTREEIEVDTFALFYLILLIVALSSTLVTAITTEFEEVVSGLIQWLVLLAVFSTLIAFFAYFEALRTISANTASVLLLLQVLVPFSIDYLFLDRRYSGMVIFGAVCILVAMVIVVTIPYYYGSSHNTETQKSNR